MIATKFGIKFDTSSNRLPYPIVADASPDRIRKSVEGSLKRLQVECIDLYYQHRMDLNVPAEEVAGVMAELIKEGKVRHWGVSEANEEYVRRAHSVCPITAVENRYSMMARHHESLFPVLEELGIGFVAFSPLANGNFYPDRLIDFCQFQEIIPAVNQVETHPFQQQKVAHEIMKKYGVQHESWGPFAEGRKDMFNNPTIKSIGDKYGKSVAQVILRFLIQSDVRTSH